MGPLLVHLVFQGVLLFDALGWDVKMPKEIHGLKGSCLVIPCYFSYSSNPPKNPRRVVWYQWVSMGYPLVYDSLHARDVIDKFRGQTGLYGIYSSHWDCSLLIYQVAQTHHGEKIYAWIDPENVGRYTYRFFDVTTTIFVDEYPELPKIDIYGGGRMTETITVVCSAFHACPYSKPKITLNGIEGSDEIKDEFFKDGQWKTTLTRTAVLKAETLTVKCLATHYGDIKATATKDIRSKCFHQKIRIEPEMADVSEGVEHIFTCSVYHSCQKENPTITWNYENMQVSKGSKTLSGLDRVTYSNITFLPALEDHGKKLTCTVKTSGGNTETAVVLHVKEYQYPEPFQNETYFQNMADMIPRITALPRSCVVIPCSFKMDDEYVTQLRVLWVTKKSGYMFHTDPMDVSDNFKGRTRLLGDPDEQNCTVEIDNVQTHDNGPFCFQAERENEKYSFNNSCVFIVMQKSPDEPVMSTLPEEIEPGTRVTVKCSVNHTCSSHPPQITWSVPTVQETINHNPMGGGVWETVSIVSFISTGYEEQDEIVCSANFWGGKTQSNSSAPMSVKSIEYRGVQGIKPETVGLYAIAPSLVFILIFIFAGVFIYKRRHRQPHHDMQESQYEQRRSIWNRFSSRFSMSEERSRAAWTNKENRSDIRFTGIAPERPPKPAQRRSFWTRFSRNQSPKTDLKAEYKANNASAVSENKNFSKPNMPSSRS